MISSQPHRANNLHPLVIDASVAINLLGTGRPADFLHILGQRVIIEETTYREVDRNPFNGNSGHDSLDHLVSKGLLHLERLSDEGYELFLELTGASSPDDLGDGEAATIAHSTIIGGIPLLDEKKGSRIARERGLTVMSTLDLFRSQRILRAMRRDELADTVYAALIKARMRVPLEHRRWIVDLIGAGRAASCSSLGSPFAGTDT